MSECKNCLTPIMGESVPCSRCGEVMHKDCATVKCSCGEVLCDVCFLSHEKCKTCEEEAVVKLDTIRRSHIELYARCPYAFELEVVKGLGHAQTIYTQSGIDLHDMFDEYSKHDNGDALEMFEIFMEKYEQHYPREWYNETYATREKMIERYKRNIDGFLALRSTLPKPLITEEKVFLNVGDNLPTVNITMDRIDEEDGELVLGDYKTGKVMVGKKFTTDLQVPLYIKCVKSHYGKPVKRFDLYYTGEGKIRSFIRDESNHDLYSVTVNKRIYTVSLDATVKEVRTRLDKITKGLFNIDPHQKQYDCRSCQFFEKQCAGVDTETWKQARR